MFLYQVPQFIKTAAILCVLFIFISSQASAAFKGINPAQANLPIILKAENVTGNQANETLVATGNVEVIKGDSIIYSDKISYDKKNQLIWSNEDVFVKNLEIGNLYAKTAKVKDDFSSGNFSTAKIVLANGSYLTADNINRQSELITVLLNPIYSICPNPDISENNKLAGTKKDLFSIKSTSSTIDRGTQLLKSKNAIVRVNNFPIFYTPALTTPLPDNKRKSGFLAPTYFKNSKLGVLVKAPYFIDIAENKDLTISPFVPIGSENLILGNEFRHVVSNGDYKVNLELANNKITANNDVAITNRTKKPYRYNLNSTGKFDFDRFLTANLDINTVGDRDYLRDYHNTYLAYTVSQADVDYIKGRSHSSLSSVRFQELENPLLQNQAPLVLPRFNSHIETAKPLISNERYFLNTDLAILTREEGLQYQRISLEPGVRLPFNIAGNLFDLEAKSQNDYYHLTGDLANPESSAQNFKSYISNQKNKFNAKWSLPLIKKTDPSTLMVEPIAMLSSTSYKGDYTKIPNQDSANGELSMNNLFSDNRISGYDRSETGERVSYGARSSLFNSLGEFEFNFGQSYRLSNQSQDVTVLGFNATNKSSVVGDFFYKASKHFTMRYDFQLNDSTFLNEINDVNANLVFDRFSFNTSYLLMRRTASNDIKKEQVQLISGIKLTKQWSTQLMLVRDLTNGINLNRSIALKYDGCCTIVDFTVSEQDLGNLTAPNRSFSFSVTVKNLTVM